MNNVNGSKITTNDVDFMPFKMKDFFDQQKFLVLLGFFRSFLQSSMGTKGLPVAAADISFGKHFFLDRTALHRVSNRVHSQRTGFLCTKVQHGFSFFFLKKSRHVNGSFATFNIAQHFLVAEL